MADIPFRPRPAGCRLGPNRRATGVSDGNTPGQQAHPYFDELDRQNWPDSAILESAVKILRIGLRTDCCGKRQNILVFQLDTWRGCYRIGGVVLKCGRFIEGLSFGEANVNRKASVRELTRGRGESTVSARRRDQSVWGSFSRGRVLVAVALFSLAARGVVWGQCTSGIETVAGLVALGDGGLATAAQLRDPSGVAVDSAGNLYIADSVNNRIRKVSTSGLITTVAGTGIGGFSGDGGPATAAQLSAPRGVAVDSAGNLYIADSENFRIRKVRSSGIITTVAGNGTSGYSGDGGAATAAQLNQPSGVVRDSAGNLFIVDSGNHSIRKMSPDGTITTMAGSGFGGYSGDGGAAVLPLRRGGGQRGELVHRGHIQ